MVLSFFLILTLFTTTVISHITSDANFYYLAHPTKRHNGLGSACKQASDCHHLHGARPKCEKGKCTFECASSSGYELSQDGTHCLKCCKQEPNCSHPIPKHSTRTCNSHGGCDFECVLGYVKSADDLTCQPACKSDSSCHTEVAHAKAVCLPRGICGIKCNANYRLSKDKKTCSYTTHSTSQTTTLSSTPSSTSSTSTPTPTPTCGGTDFSLVGASEHQFNKAGAVFSMRYPCPILNTQKYAVLANGQPVLNTTISSTEIGLPGFAEPYVLLSVYALDVHNNTIFASFTLIFGSISKSVTVLDAKGQPAANVVVQANSTIYPGVGQTGITDASGVFTFANLIPTTLSLVAKASDNQVAIAGVSSNSAGSTLLKLIPFDSGVAGNGTTQLVKREPGFTVSTSSSPSLQMVSKVFTPHPFTKTAYISYLFQTDEVPGGFFGTQFNDYFSLMIRSDVGGYNAYTNSMNALGLPAFDASGATGNYTLLLDITGAGRVNFDVAVSNVGDAAYQSRVIVSEYGDLTCNKCDNTCANCPGDPMCQPACANPPPKTCSFYRSCAEAKQPCGSEGYALGFGEYFCLKFDKNIKGFSPAGQNWVYSVMTCLQKALISAVTCDVSCSFIESAAFASHAPCYLEAGLCDLGVGDLLQLTSIVWDKRTRDALTETLHQVQQTSAACAAGIITGFNERIGELMEQLSQEVVDLVNKAAVQITLNAVEITKMYIEKSLGLF